MKPIKETAGRYKWAVYVPPGYNGKQKRHHYRFESKERALDFCAIVERWKSHKRAGVVALAVSDAETNWLGFLKNELDGDLSLLPAIVSHYKKTSGLTDKATVSELFENWLVWKAKRVKEKTIRSDIRPRIRQFTARHGDLYAHEVTPDLVEAYLDDIPNENTRRNHYKWLRAMFEWAKVQRLVGINPLANIGKPKRPSSIPKVYTPEDARKLLEAAHKNFPSLLPWVALIGWNFLRSAEIVPSYPGRDVLSWSDFLLDRPDPLIHVRPEVAKQTTKESGSARYIPLTHAAAHWLRGRIGKSGPVYPYSEGRFYADKAKLFEAAGVKQKIKNGLRHSCISYFIAKDVDNGVAATAKMAGNSEFISRKHYLQILTPDLGELWWSIRPEKG